MKIRVSKVGTLRVHPVWLLLGPGKDRPEKGLLVWVKLGEHLIPSPSTENDIR